jgi:hypothetical protein
MKKNFFFVFALLAIQISVMGQITSAQSGPWATGSTWVGGVAPTSADNVIIASGHTVTLNTATTIASLTINATGQLTITGSITLTINGSFINSGTLSIVGHLAVRGDFTIQTGGILDANGSAAQIRPGGANIVNNGTIDLGSGAFGANIGDAVNVAQTISGTGVFDIGRLVVANQNAAGISLAVSFAVGDVALFSPGKLFLGNSNLTSGSFNSIGSTTAYIVTNGTGRLIWDPVSATTITIPVGNSTHNPIRIANNTSLHTFSVKVNDNLTNAAYGPAIVNAEWDILDVTGGAVSVDISPFWYTTDEAPTFSRTNCYVSHYMGGSWQQVSTSGAATQGGALWFKTGTGVTSFSPFGVGNGCDLTLPPIVSDQSNQSQCNNGDFTMTQSTPSAGTGVWTLESGTATITTPTLPTTTVTGVPVGTSATLKWTVTNGACSAFDLVTLTNDAQPVVSDQPNQTQCNNESFTMSQSTPSIGTGLWSLQSGTANITTPSSPTTTITGIPTGTSAVVKWTLTNGACSAFDLVTLTNDAQPVVGDQPNQAQCNNGSFTMAQSTSSIGTGVWSLQSGTANITTPSSPTSTVTGVPAGTSAIVKWTVTNGACSAFDLVILTNDAQAVVSDQANQAQCNNGSYTMTQSTPSIGTGAWSLQSGTANITAPGSPTTTITGVPAGTSAVVKWTVTNGSCSAFDLVTLTNDVQPVVSDQSNQTQTNNGNFTMTQGAPSVGTGVWTLQSGTASITTPGSPTTTVTGVPAGTVAIVKWTVTNGTCSAFDLVTLTNNNNVEQPVVSDQPNQAQCNNGSFTMTQSTPSIGTGVWTLESGTANITTPGSPTTTVTGVPVGTSAVVKWSVTNGGLSAFDLVTLINHAQPVVSDQSNQIHCNNGSFTMTQSAPSIGTGVWTLQSGTANITTPNSPTTTVTGVPAGTSAVVKWTVTNGTCSAFDLVTLTNDAQPSVSDQQDQSQCNNGSFTMTQSAPVIGMGVWTLQSGTANITTPNSPTTTVTGVPAGTVAVAKWTVTNGTCSAFDLVTLDNTIAIEICNGIDDDCDGQIDEGFDVDDDGYTTCDGDCNDNDASINPGVTEFCTNNVDDDCDGQINESCSTGITISIADATVLESAGTVQVQVSLSASSSSTISVKYKTSNGTARHPKDYNHAMRTLTFLPGQVTMNIIVPILTDNITEGDENFFIKLTRPANATISDNNGTVTITETSLLLRNKNNYIPEVDGVGKIKPVVINPQRKQEFLRFYGLSIGGFDVLLTDATGRTVANLKNYSNNWSMANLKAGIYFYRIRVKGEDKTDKYYSGRVLITE